MSRSGLEFPKTREAAENTPFDIMWKTPDHWPRHVRLMSVDDQGLMGIDPRSGEIYWDGSPIVTEKRLSNVERGLVVAGLAIGATGTAAGVAVAIVEIGRTCCNWV